MLAPTIRRFVSATAGGLMRPPQGMDFDFTQPRGEPALVPPNSISWRIFKNPVSLFVGGVAAVILELAEPSVRSGVWEHSSFRRDAVTRLRRTGFAAMMTVYGPRSAAERMIERVMRMHDRVRGTTPEGRPYHANDQRLLDWVQGTAPYGFIEAYHRFVRPLAADERSRAFAEGAVAARLYGALGAPASLQEWQRMLAETEPALQPSDTIFEFLDIMGSAPIAPRPFRPIQRLLIRAAVDLTPPELRRKLGLEEYGLSAMQRKLVETMGQASEKLPLLTAPPAQASVRMGLEPDYLYR